jgi:UDP-2,4-diacetamido-2,4,6-trideoxy-beta-L-altropyranose hydrolase
MQIVFRTESNNTIGTGHLMRCLSLAKELENKTAISFILSYESSKAENFIKSTLDKCIVFILPE